MKSRLLWAAVLVAAIAGFYWVTIRPALRETPPKVDRHKLDRDFQEFKPPPIPPPPLPVVVIPTPTLPPPPAPRPLVAPRRDPVPGPLEVPIQDRATIDFSTGAAVVKKGGKDDEALDRALKEMAEATKDITFPPTKK